MYNENGKMRTVLERIGGKCYYFHEDGHMAKSEKYKGKMGEGMLLMKMEFAFYHQAEV